jgi:hypothetical protein
MAKPDQEWSSLPDPVMPVGKYKGIAVSKLPVSYCRWILLQAFTPDIMEAAKKKVEASVFNNIHIGVSRHALDMFSLRFLDYWDKEVGLASFVANYAQRAWEEGVDVSKKRHQDDGIVKSLDGLRFVFIVSTYVPDYKEVITIYSELATDNQDYPHGTR